MTTNHEKRRYRRYPHGASLSFSHFHSTPSTPDSGYRGEKLSHGIGGLSFKSAYALKPGAILMIKLGRLESGGLESDAYGGMRTISLGQVKWCRPLEGGQGYAVGVQYLNT
jgi:hypothetical protein